MQIIDKSQGHQSCAGPQRRKEGRFQARAAPTASTPLKLCMLGLLSPAIFRANSYLPLKACPSISSSRTFLRLWSQEAPSQPLPQCHHCPFLVRIWGTRLTSPPFTLLAWVPRKAQERGPREPAAPPSTATLKELGWNLPLSQVAPLFQEQR